MSAKPSPAPLPASCGECSYFVHQPEQKPDIAHCLRRCPGTTERDKTIVYWPEVHRTSRCSRGAVAGNEAKAGVVSCYLCLHWWQPNGEPITPEGGRFGMSKDWWAATGICTAVAPGPSTEPRRMTFWHVTHADQGCGEGEPVPPLEPTP